MVGGFKIDVIWGYFIFTGPRIVDCVYEFFSNVNTEFVIPAVIELEASRALISGRPGLGFSKVTALPLSSEVATMTKFVSERS